jgi:hypothetical protein
LLYTSSSHLNALITRITIQRHSFVSC